MFFPSHTVNVIRICLCRWRCTTVHQQKIAYSLSAPSHLLTPPTISALDASFQLVELGTINDLAYLELTALDVDAQFERMVLAFGDGALERLILEDAFGMRTEMRFQDGVRNPPLAADLFRFAPPPGVDVVGEWPVAETP